MEYVIVAFRSRAETVAFAKFLTNNGINNQIVNTPKEAGVGCGLSVKINKVYLSAIKRAINTLKTKSFAGFFVVKRVNGKNIIHTI